MDPSLLQDARLLFIMLLAGAVSMLTTVNVAARPAAVRTGQVNLAFSVSAIFFMLTRFANLFYLPILAAYVDRAVRTGRVDILYGQIQWVVAGAAGGALLSWLLLPTFIAIYERGIDAVERHGSVLAALARLPRPRGARAALGCLRPPSCLGVRGPLPEGIPWDFLLWNVLATAIWTVGALCALYTSAVLPQFEATAVLLSGLINAAAAIAFTLSVDPRAAVITDQAVHGQRPARDVDAASFFLGAGNFLGSLLGLAVLPVGIAILEEATARLGGRGGDLVSGLWGVVALNALVTLLASTTVTSRISAAVTRRAATALAVYNLFFLVTRLAQQVYAPILGSVRDFVLDAEAGADSLLPLFRQVLLGASAGVAAGWLLMPTFVELYQGAILALDRRQGSMPRLLADALHPRRWPRLAGCLRRPSLMGVGAVDLLRLPRAFLLGNLLVVAIHSVGVMAAIQAGAELSSEAARTATLLSSVVNGVATILLSLVVDPSAARITDQALHDRRPLQDVRAMAVGLTAGTLLGTLLSQALLLPAAAVIATGARLLEALF